MNIQYFDKGENRIKIEQVGSEFDYEIQVENYYRRDDWHTRHWEEGFSSAEEALKAAEKWIDNYEPDSYSSEGMSFREEMANYQRLK